MKKGFNASMLNKDNPSLCNSGSQAYLHNMLRGKINSVILSWTLTRIDNPKKKLVEKMFRGINPIKNPNAAPNATCFGVLSLCRIVTILFIIFRIKKVIRIIIPK